MPVTVSTVPSAVVADELAVDDDHDQPESGLEWPPGLPTDLSHALHRRLRALINVARNTTVHPELAAAAERAVAAVRSGSPIIPAYRVYLAEAKRIDRRVQRTSINEAHVRGIASHFNADAFGVLAVSRRSDGELVLLDGQHRKAALDLMEWGDQSVPCHVHEGLSLAQEAAIFRLLNNTRKPGTTDRFLVQIVSGDPTATAIAEIADSLGWQIYPRSADGYIAAVDGLLRVYTGRATKTQPGDNPVALRSTLQTITTAFGHDYRAVQAVMLVGVGAVFRRDGNRIDEKGLAHKLGSFAGGIDGLLGKARGLAVSKNNVSAALSFVVVQLHNKGKKGNALPYWPL